MKNIEVIDEVEIQVKRFYLPIKLSMNCPHCQAIIEKDFECDYLSYPTTNKKESIYLYCDECDGESEFDAILKISLDVDDQPRRAAD